MRQHLIPLIFALIAALLFLSGTLDDLVPLRVLVKATPALLLAYMLRGRDDVMARTHRPALVFCAAGDAILDLPVDAFVPGLLSFLVAQSLFAAGMYRDAPRFGGWVGAVVAAYLITMYAWIWPGLGPLWLPVFIYVCVIGAMIWRAGARLVARGHKGASRGLVGAVSFGISDSMIAVDRFVAGWDVPHLWIMLTYWLGILGLTAGAVYRDRRETWAPTL